MAYLGKYVDRNPCIRTAGIPSNITEVAGDSFKIYHLEEAAEDICRLKCKEVLQNQKDFSWPACPHLPKDNIEDLLSTELKKSRFVAFREKFSEDMFFKKPELGRVYPLHTKPDNITNENTTFGTKYDRSEPMYELIFPHKTPEEVNREYIDFHEKYLLSHNHFLPGEQKRRNYSKEYFDPTSTFGIKNRMDITGANVRNCLTQCNRMIVISKVQKYYLERSMGRLGTKITRYTFDYPDEMTFGGTTIADKCDTRALLENINPCVEKSHLPEAISHINKLRYLLFQRPNFNIQDLRAAMATEDKQRTGYLSLKKIFEIVRAHFIRLNEQKIRIALQHFGLIEDIGLSTERVNHSHFCRLFTVGHPLPSTGNISIMPTQNYNKETSYRSFCEDLSKKPVEGLPEKPKTEVITTAKDCITPDIPMLLGLTPVDFDQLRPKSQLMRIFKQITPDDFEQIWKRANDEMKLSDDMISVNDFRQILNEGREKAS